MLKNYFKIAYRTLLRHKSYSLINILGLAVGIACSIVILLYVQDELSYDKYHTKHERIYRVTQDIDPVEESASLPLPVAKALANDYPHLIEEIVRFHNSQTTVPLEHTRPSGELLQFNEQHCFFVDSTVFKIFDWELIKGNRTEVLNQPNSIVLTESAAKRYFGEEDPMGKVVRFSGVRDLSVTGVMKDIPKNSHFKVEILISFSTLRPSSNWYWNPAWTYVLLPEGVEPAELEAQFPAFVNKYFGSVSYGDNTSFNLQPITDIHLYSHRDYEVETNSDVSLVYIFSIIAFTILLIAGINFVNLATARSIKRAKEVGVRKVLGANKNQLIKQYLAESVIVCFIAMLIALPLADIIIPFVNGIAEKSLSLVSGNNLFLWGGIFLATIIIGLVSGIYPALFLASFQPVKVLGGKIERLGGGMLLRKVLVVTQFTVSIVLIIGTLIVSNQLGYLRSANLGFDKEQIIVMPIQGSSLVRERKLPELRNRLLQNPNIVSVTGSNMIIGTATQNSNYTLQGSGAAEGEMISAYFVNHDFTKTFDIPITAGRSFDLQYASSDSSSAIINESLARYWGFENNEDALGRTVHGSVEGDLRIVGVMKDFHFRSLREPLGNFLITLPRFRDVISHYFYVKVKPDNMDETIDYVEATFTGLAPERAFEYFFLDGAIERLYKSEDALVTISTFFSAMAIVIACLGLFGLTAFTVEQKTKEIGIRKVVGASTWNIVVLLTKQFFNLLLIANLISYPLAYMIMNYWLRDFSRQISIDVIPFAAATGATLLIAAVTISFQSVKAASVNPIQSIKYE